MLTIALGVGALHGRRQSQRKHCSVGRNVFPSGLFACRVVCFRLWHEMFLLRLLDLHSTVLCKLTLMPPPDAASFGLRARQSMQVATTLAHLPTQHYTILSTFTAARTILCLCWCVSVSNDVLHRPVILPNPGFRLLLAQVTLRIQMRLILVFCLILRGCTEF
jgi:hypothetical protein